MDNGEEGLAPLLPAASLRRHYFIYRNYMKHEDDLLNQRSTWHLLIQGFLFGTLGVIGQWQLITGGTDTLHSERYYLVFVISAVGLLIALLASISLHAADSAIEQLCKDWKRVRGLHNNKDYELLPEIAGGGAKNAKTYGKLAAIWIPRVVMAAWVVVVAMATYDRLYPSTPPPSTPAPVKASERHYCGQPIADARQLTRQQLVQEIACSIENSDALQKQLQDRFQMKISLSSSRARSHSKSPSLH